MQDRKENVRRVSELAALLVAQGYIALCPLINPYREDRLAAYARFGIGPSGRPDCIATHSDVSTP